MNRIATTLAIGALLGSSAASANHIDFLDEGAFTLTQNGSGSDSTTVTGIDPASTLGGQRFVELSLDSNTATANASLTQPFGPGADDDALTYTTGGAGSLELAIDGGNSDLNANFLDIPGMNADWDRVRLDFGLESAAADDVTVRLFSDGVGQLTSTQSFAGGDGVLDFLHTSFGPDATPAFLRDIDAASFQINAPGAGTYTIESFNRNGFVPEAVPEPGSLGLVMLGLLGLFGVTALRRGA